MHPFYESERIAYGEMEGETIFEAFEVIESRTRRLVWGMQTNADIKTKNKEIEVVTQTGSRANRNVLEVVHGELTSRALGVLTQEPHVSSIKEDGAVERPEKTGAKFGIGLELEVTRLVDVGILAVVAAIASRTDGAHGEGTHAVGAADIKLVGIGRSSTVAIAIDGASEEASRETEARIEADVFVAFSSDFHELGKGTSEEVLVLLAEFLSSCGVDARSDVAGLFD